MTDTEILDEILDWIFQDIYGKYNKESIGTFAEFKEPKCKAEPYSLVKAVSNFNINKIKGEINENDSCR